MNKLEILLVLSAVLVLYPSISALIDAQNAISELRHIPSELLDVRNNAIMQVVGLIFLYVFLYFFLNSYLGKQATQQIKPSADNTPTQQVNLTSKRINPQWSFVAGFLVALTVSVWQFVSGIMNGVNSIIDALILPIVYGVVVGCFVGIGCYFLFKHVIEVER
jgi:sterol desaturase/sphingolipid hydroxylase (fatty acid hydroxylase superfamily)